MSNLSAAIVAAEKELVVRESAAKRLRGISAKQNAAAIERLYDVLVCLHIDRMEHGNA